MALMTNHLLNTDSITFLDNLVVTHPKRSKQEIMDETLRQFMTYEKRVTVSTNPDRADTIQYTGKIGGNQDDIVQTIARCIRGKYKDYNRVVREIEAKFNKTS